jgi:hypothetical protein
MMQLYHGIAVMLFRYHGYGWRQRTTLALRDVKCSRDFAPVTSPYIHIKSKPKTLSRQKSFWSTHILTWDGVKTLGILTSDATTVWAAFLSTRAVRIPVASVDARCVEYGQWRAVRTEARLHVVIRQTIIYALEHKMWYWLQHSLVSCRSHILNDKCDLLNHKIQGTDNSTPVGQVGLLAGYSITRNGPADPSGHAV